MNEQGSSYRVSVGASVDARHFFPGSRDPEENREHSHHYRVSLTAENDDLDRHGYVVDIAELRKTLGRVLDTFRGTLLNAHPLLRGLPPSIENLARCICSELAWREALPVKAVEVTVAEENDSSAAYREERS